MIKRSVLLLVVLGILAGIGFAQEPLLPPPNLLPSDATAEQIHAEMVAVQGILCGDINNAAQILMKTGTLGAAIPHVVEITGLTHAEVDSLEKEVCQSDLSALSFEELRFKNRQAVWLLDVHMTAMKEVLGTQ